MLCEHIVVLFWQAPDLPEHAALPNALISFGVGLVKQSDWWLLPAFQWHSFCCSDESSLDPSPVFSRLAETGSQLPFYFLASQELCGCSLLLEEQLCSAKDSSQDRGWNISRNQTEKWQVWATMEGRSWVQWPSSRGSKTMHSSRMGT